MSLRSCCCALWILLAAIPHPAAQYKFAVQQQPVRVPNFKGKTLQQVQAAALVPGTKRPLFAAIDPQGPANGVVASQTPAPGTPVVPGESRLLLTLDNPPPNILQNILQAIAAAQQNRVQVPDLTGQNRTVASGILKSAHLRAVFHGNENGLVAQQSPPAGNSVAQGSAVTLTLALPQAIVPLLVGKTAAGASALLSAASLQTGTITGDNTGASIVTAQTPPAGTHVDPGTAVDLTLSTPVAPPPPPSVFVPDLVKLTPSQASERLARVGLQLGRVSGPKGIIGSQQPAPNAQVLSGSAVDVVLVARPAPQPVPAGTNDGSPDPQPTPSPTPVRQQLPAWLIVLASAGGLLLITLLVKALLDHCSRPPSTAYTVFTRKPVTRPVIRNHPSLRYKLVVRDGRPATQSIIEREPRVTQRKRS